MRGGSQAFLVLGADTHSYVVKFFNNPQGNRVLVNEWIASRILRDCGVTTPPQTLMNFDRKTAGKNDLKFMLGSESVVIQPGVHLGSRTPVNPEKVAIFDFLPRTQFHLVGNLEEFSSMFVLDGWMGQSDTRQAVFARDRALPNRAVFRAHFIDHGYCFGGCKWQFKDDYLNGVYCNKDVYNTEAFEAEIEHVIQKIERLSLDQLITIAETVPSEWLSAQDADELVQTILELDRRRVRIRQITERRLAANMAKVAAPPKRSSMSHLKVTASNSDRIAHENQLQSCRTACLSLSSGSRY